MNTIVEQWADYEAKVVPRDAPSVQRKEMRRAFYAGAHAALMMLHKLAGEPISEDAGAAVLEGLHLEARAFALAVEQGRA